MSLPVAAGSGLGRFSRSSDDYVSDILGLVRVIKVEDGVDALVLNSYQLNSKKELTCKDLRLSGSTYQALAEGVEDFQLRYAEANPNTQTIQWKTANQVTDMTQVLAIEVCLRVASINTVHNTKPSAKFLGCQGEALPTDGRVRRTFKRVVTLRNRDRVMP